MSVTQTIKEPAPFLALMITLACGIAVITALAISIMIAGALNPDAKTGPTQAPATKTIVADLDPTGIPTADPTASSSTEPTAGPLTTARVEEAAGARAYAPVS